MKQLPNLLIVDDIEENIVLLAAISQKAELNVIRARSGAEALEKIRGKELALAIIDVLMPQMNGYELARKMNEERIQDKVPIIFLTAGNRDGALEGYDSGAVDYLIKPVPKHVLLSKIKVFLDLYNQKQIIIRDALLLKESADELVRMNEALKQSEEKYRSYIDFAPDGVFVIDKSGRFLELNTAFCRLIGHSPEILLSMFVQNIFKGESFEILQNNLKNASKFCTTEADLQFEHPDGSNHWCCLVLTALDENRMLAFVTDITHRKNMEEALKSSLDQLQQLEKYKEKARENERKTIARELHDDLGQSLTAVKIDLSIIKQQIHDEQVLTKITKISDLVGDTIKSVQRLTSELRPEIIDDLGLDAAIKWYTKEFAQRNDMEISTEIDSDLVLAPDDSITLFRIMQESLTNIARHSHATRVDIKLVYHGDHINFRIADNGVGISDVGLNSKKSFGIIGMKERALSLGGTCDIFSDEGGGTVINLIFPFVKKIDL